ncbi:hypothetical protein, partial [Fusobacterium sp. PH5-44]|uniref:hypothetical protein n=1 Tax=unclassified Fusobacterium TaxID=2648384 RepID=UPI003D1FEBD7
GLLSIPGSAKPVGGLLTLVSGKTVYDSGVSVHSAAKEGDSAGVVVHSMNGLVGIAGIYGGVKIYRTPTVGVGQILENKNIPSSKTQNSSNSKILEQLKTYMKNGTKNGKNIITQVDDKTKIIFRKDFGGDAHPILNRGYYEPVNHYNIEVQTSGIKGKVRKESFHIIMDKKGNIIDKF